MKILKVFDQAELVLVDLEVNLGNRHKVLQRYVSKWMEKSFLCIVLMMGDQS